MPTLYYNINPIFSNVKMRFYIRKVKVKKYIILVIRIGQLKISINRHKNHYDYTINFNNWDK